MRDQKPESGASIKFLRGDPQARAALPPSPISHLASRIKTAVLALLLWLPAAAWGQDVEVTASVGSEAVGIRDQFQLSITVTGKDSGDAENPRVSRLPGFRIVSGPNISTQFRWVNGRSGSSRSYSYVLMPEKEGQFTIDPIEVRVRGKVFKTRPLEVRVTSASPGSPAQSRRHFDPFEEEDIPAPKSVGDAVFVAADLDRTTAYPGQQVTLTHRVYTQVGINGIQIEDSPPLSGFWVENIEVDKNPRGAARIVDGREYRVFVIRKQALFPTDAGRIRVPPSTFALSVGAGGDLFGIFGRTQTLYRKSDELFLNVKPLPAANRPADFRNAVGTFSLSAHTDKTRIATGEAVAFELRLEGEGNLKMIPDLPMPSIPDFTVYDAKRGDSVRVLDSGRIGGGKTWEFVLVPKVPGRQTLPPVAFSFFNPEREAYETISTPPIGLDVVRGAERTDAASLLSGGDKQNVVRRGNDIHFIKLSPGKLEREQKPPYRNPWLVLAFALPVLCNVAILLYRRRARDADGAGSVRSRRAGRAAVRRLTAAERRGGTDARRFYDEAAAALSGYLIDAFGLTEIELTGDSLERALAAKSVPRETAEETVACLRECDFGRFVSASESGLAKRELGIRIRRCIEAVEACRKNSARAAAALTVLLLFCCWNPAAPAAPDSPERLFSQGNAAYQAGDYASAENRYRAILDSGHRSGALYFNLGNACFKQKRLGDAIFFWEKARQILPADREVRENLGLADLMVVDRIDVPGDPLPFGLPDRAASLLSIGQGLWILAGLFFAANVLFALYLLAASRRASVRALFAGCAVAGLTLALSGLVAWKIYDQDFRQKAVVVEQRADVRSGPGPENIAVFTIHEGTRVRVHGNSDGWRQISLPNGWSGWLRESCIRIF